MAMKARELRDHTVEELLDRERELADQLFALRLQKVTGQLEKPAETRMGSGKGAPDHWVAVVKPGRILFEMAGVDHADAVEAMRLASHKLGIKTRFITRHEELR